MGCLKWCQRLVLALVGTVVLIVLSALYPHFQAPDSSLASPEQFLSLTAFDKSSFFVKVPLHGGSVNVSVIVSGVSSRSRLDFGNCKAVVVLLHGFPDTPLTFAKLATALVSAGYCTFAPFLRGYEGSSLNVSYYALDIDADVVALLDYFGVQQAHVVGHDWGAGIAYRIGGHLPSRILSVTGMAIPYVWFADDFVKEKRMKSNAAYTIYFQFAFLAHWDIARNDFAYFDRLWAKWSPNTTWTGSRELEAIKEVFRRGHPHTLWGSIGYYRQNMPVRYYSESILTAQQKDMLKYSMRVNQPVFTPTQVLYGREDGCADKYGFEAHELSYLFPSGAYRQRGVDAAGHFMHLERPDSVNTAILDWIQSNQSKGHPRGLNFSRDTFDYARRVYINGYRHAPSLALASPKSEL